MLEDDVFFAELSKRISLLITDDDEADFGTAQFPAAVPVVPGFSVAHVPQGASVLAPPAYTLYHHAASYSGSSNNSSSGNGGQGARTWQQQCGSKGTGVFIPRSSPGSAHSKKRGKNKSGSNAKARAQAGSTLAAGAPTKSCA